jgi:uncharacterized glyoxalase superfamily protein PhnB
MRVVASIDVGDLERAVEFYSRGLGFREERRLFDGSAAEMSAGSSLVYLLVKQAGSPPFTGSQQSRSYTRHWTPVHLDLVVEDIETAVANATNEGAVLEDGIHDRGSWREATLSDPFGHGFCLLEGWPP